MTAGRAPSERTCAASPLKTGTLASPRLASHARGLATSLARTPSLSWLRLRRCRCRGRPARRFGCSCWRMGIDAACSVSSATPSPPTTPPRMSHAPVAMVIAATWTTMRCAGWLPPRHLESGPRTGSGRPRPVLRTPRQTLSRSTMRCVPPPRVRVSPPPRRARPRTRWTVCSSMGAM